MRRDDGARGTSDGLSAEELWRFHNDGFVVPDCRLLQDVVAEMREAYDSALLKWVRLF